MARLSSCTQEVAVILQKGQSGNVSRAMLRKFCAKVWASLNTALHGLRPTVFAFFLNVNETLPFSHHHLGDKCVCKNSTT